MKRLILPLLLLAPAGYVAAAEIANLDEPLKKSYDAKNSESPDGYSTFFQTGENVDSYSMTCDMGQAIPDPDRPGWYNNSPIGGLKLELRARAAVIDIKKQARPQGFVVVTKHGEVLLTFRPLGEFVRGAWNGDVFNAWSGSATDIMVFSELLGQHGYAHFDLIDGKGFFYKSDKRDEPDYFLSNCVRIKKENLPVYDWK